MVAKIPEAIAVHSKQQNKPCPGEEPGREKMQTSPQTRTTMFKCSYVQGPNFDVRGPNLLLQTETSYLGSTS